MMNNKGIVLPVTLAFVLAFTLLGSATIYLSTMQNEAAERRIASEKAFWLAEAGIQRALWEVRNNSCRGLIAKASGLTCATGCAKCGEKIFASADGDMEGHYNFDMNSASSSVTSTGSYPNRTPAPNRVQRTVQLTNPSQFDYAIFADQQIKLFNKTVIDSYNSDLGSYGPSNNASNGDIGSNIDSTSKDKDHVAISLQDYGFHPINVFKGDVSTGPGGTISGPGLDDSDIDKAVTGVISHENKIELLPVVVPSSLKDLPQKDKLVITDTYTLPEGKYKFPSINVKSNGKLYIEGNVKIYLTKTNLEAFDALKVTSNSQVIINANSSLTVYSEGNISVENGSGINNVNQDPKKLTIYSTVTSDKVTDGIDIWNSSDFYGAIYAPGAHVNITNNGNIFGSFIGRDFTVSGGAHLHYDESLAGEITKPTAVWQEISN